MFSSDVSLNGINGSKINIYDQKDAMLAEAANFIFEDALNSATVIYKLNKKGTYTFHVNLHDKRNDISESDIRFSLKNKLENYITQDMNCSLRECSPISVEYDGKIGRNWKVSLTINKNSAEKLRLPQSKEVAQQALLISQLQEVIQKKNEIIAIQNEKMSSLGAKNMSSPPKIEALESRLSTSMHGSQYGHAAPREQSSISQLQRNLATQISLNTQQEELINQLLENNSEQNHQIELLKQELKERDHQLESQSEFVERKVKERYSQHESQMRSMQMQLEERDVQLSNQEEIIVQMGQAQLEEQQRLQEQTNSLKEMSETVSKIIEKFTCPVDFEVFTGGAFVTPSGNTFNNVVKIDIEKRGLDPFEVPTTIDQIYPNRVVLEATPLVLKLQAELEKALPKEEKNGSGI